MDWFSWLSRTNLDASLIYDYSLSFSYNQLEYNDIAYFNHEILQSMGISIAKHRLEILKLARRDRKPSPFTARSFSRVLIAIRKTGKCLSKYVRVWIRREQSSRALVAVESNSEKGVLLKRNKRSEMLMLTNGSFDSFSNPMVFDCDDVFKKVKWDSLFQNLKPT